MKLLGLCGKEAAAALFVGATLFSILKEMEFCFNRRNED
jgi:hypothetical protein